jgi:hypothetical protein
MVDVPRMDEIPGDAGKTSGGGSLGHDQPDDVERQTRVRNRGGTSRERTGGQRDTPEPPPELND